MTIISNKRMNIIIICVFFFIRLICFILAMLGRLALVLKEIIVFTSYRPPRFDNVILSVVEILFLILLTDIKHEL